METCHSRHDNQSDNNIKTLRENPSSITDSRCLPAIATTPSAPCGATRPSGTRVSAGGEAATAATAPSEGALARTGRDTSEEATTATTTTSTPSGPTAPSTAAAAAGEDLAAAAAWAWVWDAKQKMSQ